MGRALGVAAAVALLTGAVGGASAAPASFQLVFDGGHNSQLLHDGTFTTSSTLCPSGSASDVSFDEQTATRVFRCDGSSATFTARISPLPAEHGGTGGWQIVDGSGPLQDLRGKGSWTSVRTGGDPSNPASIRFRSTWTGIADLDAAGPTIAIPTASVRALNARAGVYLVRIALSLADAGGGRITYGLSVVDPRRPLDLLASKNGQTSTATIAVRLRVKQARGGRLLRVRLEAADEVGNQASLVKALRTR